jgi:hypothetical protein
MHAAAADWRLKVGLAILALGTGPLVLYVIFGPSDGNPIGLGLLFVFSFPFAAGFLLWGGAASFFRRLRYGPKNPQGRDAPQAIPRPNPRPGPGGNPLDNWP